MKAECYMKNNKLTTKYMKNEPRCMICDNTVFRVSRITPELIMLTCENCGEPHMIGTNSEGTETHLTFWSSETEDID